MRNGYYEVFELELAAAGRGDRDGKAAVRADLARREQPTKPPLDPAWMARMERESRERRAAFARRVALEETRSLCRRAEREQRKRVLREAEEARDAAERWLAAKETPMGQFIA